MTVPYVTPPTAVTGNPLAAVDWNAKVRDSIESIARPPSVIAYRNTDQLVGNATISVVQWLGVQSQTDTFWVAGSPSRLTVPANLGGLYLVTCNPIFDINGTGGRYFALSKNGVVADTVNTGGSASWYSQVKLAVPVILAAGDYVEVLVYHTAGAGLNLKASTYQMLFTATRLGV